MDTFARIFILKGVLPSLPLLSFLSYGGGKRRIREE